MKEKVISGIIGLVFASIPIILEKWGPDNIMAWFWQNIIVDFWFVWFGVGAGSLYLLIREAIFIHKTATKISLIDERQVEFMAKQDKRIDSLVAKKERFIDKQNKTLVDYSNVDSSLAARLDKLEAKVFSND